MPRLRRRSGPIRLQPPSDAFYKALRSVEGSYDIFLSAISSFIGRLYVASQSQQEFSSTVQRATSCSEDLALTIENTWKRLSIWDQTVRPLIADSTRATQNLVSAADTLKTDNALDGSVSILGLDFDLLFSLAMILFRIANSLMSGARVVLHRLKCRQQELRAPSQVSTAVNDDTAPRQPQDGLPTGARSGSAPSSFPRRSSSLGPCSIRSNSPELPRAKFTCTSPDHEATPQPRSLCKASRTQESSHHSPSVHPPRYEPYSRPSPGSLKVIRIGTISNESRSSLVQNQNQHHAPINKPDPSNAAQSGRKTKPSCLDFQPTCDKTPLRKPKPPLTLMKPAGGAQDGLLAAHWQSTKQLSPVIEISEAYRQSCNCRQSWVNDSLSPSRLQINENAEVTGGTFAGLVEYLTSQRSASDTAFQYAFYLTFRQFCKPRELAEQLTERFESAKNSDSAKVIQLRVSDAFQHWLEAHWRRETDQEALPIIKSFILKSLWSTNLAACRRLAQLIEHLPDQALQEPWSGPAKLTSADDGSLKMMGHRTQLSDAIKNQWGMLRTLRNSRDSSSLLSFGCIAFARQLNIKQATLFCRIPPQEFLGCAWMRKNSETAPNIKAMVSFTNQLANLVVGTILDQQTARKRAAAIEHWINIAQECSNLRNYDGLTALLSGIGHSAIVRLRRTWSLVSPELASTLQTLQMLINPSHNHKSLRTLLKTQDAPCLPFLGMYLTDLAFVDMAYPSMKPLDLRSQAAPEHLFINFTKYSRTAKIVRQLQRFQTPCELTTYHRLQQWLALKISQLSGNNDRTLDKSFFNKSLLLEPRNTT